VRETAEVSRQKIRFKRPPDKPHTKSKVVRGFNPPMAEVNSEKKCREMSDFVA